MNQPPKISVVIPAYNEATYIDRPLEALSKQNFKDFEVIVSDARSRDGTKELVDSFKDKLDVKFVEAPPKGPAFGRNQGAKHARGGWLLFLDADNDIADPDFIQILYDVTISNHWLVSSTKMNSKIPVAYTMLYWYQKALSWTSRPIASGYCIFTKRSVFEDSGGFNEKIQFGEDYEYVSRIGKGGKFGFVGSTSYIVDTRRNQQEGLAMVWKGTLNEIHRLFFGYKKLEQNTIKYEFGKHQKRQK